MKFITIILLFSFSLFAEDAVVLKKGQAAPNDGILISQQKAQDIKNDEITMQSLTQLNDSLNKSLQLQSQISDLNQQKVNLLQDQDNKLAKALQDSQSVSDWTKVLYFSLGFVIPVASFYGVRQALK